MTTCQGKEGGHNTISTQQATILSHPQNGVCTQRELQFSCMCEACSLHMMADASEVHLYRIVAMAVRGAVVSEGRTHLCRGHPCLRAQQTHAPQWNPYHSTESAAKKVRCLEGEKHDRAMLALTADRRPCSLGAWSADVSSVA